MSYHGGYVPPWERPSNHYNQASPQNMVPPPPANADLRWDDFNATVSMINNITVANKMSLIKQLNASMNLNLKATQALKAELVSRLQTYLRSIREQNDIASYIRFKEIARAYVPARWNSTSQYKPVQQYPIPSQDTHHSHSVSGASGMNYSNNWTAGRAALPTPAPPPKKPYKWKNSPLFTVSTFLTDMILVKESQSSTDRVAATANFMIPDDVRLKIEASNANPNSSPQYSIRLFCTSSTHYSPSYGQTAAASQGLPVEFPLTCEVRVNYELISASLKGLKKKPGSCPPADLMKGKTAAHPLLKMGSSNRIELIHINPNGPASKPRYYMQACLIETITSDTLLHTVQKGARRPVEKVEDFIRHMSDDAEIQMGASGLSLKCPLSYVRMTTPIRSEICDHIQCFEASSWLQINEQTPLWSCPVCEKALTLDSMFIDDYTDSILKACDSEVDEVIIEPDAAWHTADRKYGTSSWLEANPIKTPSAAPPSHQSTPKPSEEKPKEAEIYLLSSDDEDGEHDTTPSNGRSVTAPPPAVPQAAPVNPTYSAPTHASTSNTEPIDLTLDSDDEDDEQTQSYTPPPPVSGQLPLLQRLSSPPPLRPIVKTQESADMSTLGPSLKRTAPDSEEPSHPDKRIRMHENETPQDPQIRTFDPNTGPPPLAYQHPPERALSHRPSSSHSAPSPIPAPLASNTASLPTVHTPQADAPSPSSPPPPPPSLPPPSLPPIAPRSLRPPVPSSERSHQSRPPPPPLITSGRPSIQSRYHPPRPYHPSSSHLSKLSARPTSSSSSPTAPVLTDRRHHSRSSSGVVPDERPQPSVARQPLPYTSPPNEPRGAGGAGNGTGSSHPQPTVHPSISGSGRSPLEPSVDANLGSSSRGSGRPSQSHGRLVTTARPWFYPEPTASVIGASSGGAGGGGYQSPSQRHPPHVSPYSSSPSDRTGNGNTHANGSRNEYDHRNGGHGWSGRHQDGARGGSDRR